ncbi:MAG: ABC transporter permease [Alphaproteobacteria bacterium]
MSTKTAEADQPPVQHVHVPSKVMEGSRFGALFIYAVLYLAFLYVPPLFLPLFSFNDSIYVAFPLKGFTFKWYGEMAKSAGLIDALYNSLKVGSVVCVVSTVFGILAAKAVTRYYMPGKGSIVSFIMLPLVVPGIILGIGLLVLVRSTGDWVGNMLPQDVPSDADELQLWLDQHSWYQQQLWYMGNALKKFFDLSLFWIGAAHVLLAVPFSMLVLISRMEGFDKSLEEASLDLGENAWRTFWRVTFPLALPGVIASLMLTFLISFDEFILAFFLSGNQVTLPIYIWSQLRFPAKLPNVLALGSLILAVTMALVVLAESIRRRGIGSGDVKS